MLKRIWITFSAIFCLAISVTAIHAQVSPEAFTKAAGEKAAAAEASENFSLAGAADGWKFLTSELKHLAQVAPNPDAAEVIATYNNELKALGVRMIFVPVPPKANLYPEKLVDGAGIDSVTATAPFLKSLTDAGVEVIDLEPAFRKIKTAEPSKQLYCTQDSHWSPFACKVVADLVAAKLAGEDWIKGEKGGIVVDEPKPLSFYGDLLTDEEKKSWKTEQLPIWNVGKDGEVVEADKASPVTLVGDSHTFVFSEGGEMHCRGAGLLDHLQARFGFPIDLVANKGSGGHSPRMEIARRSVREPEMWDQKKLLIWCFSAREFTQGTWKKGIPAKYVKPQK